MSTYLSELVGVKEPIFSLSLRQLELASGRSSQDVHLIAEIIEFAHEKMRILGLDPNDTKGIELYNALKVKATQDDAKLLELLNVPVGSSAMAVLSAVVSKVQSLGAHKQAWVIKNSVAKKMLVECPPLRVMKQLNHKSIESMLKRENMTEIYAAMRFCETPAWLNKFVKQYKNLQANDFEMRDVEVVLLSSEKWGKAGEACIRQQRHHIVHLKEFGVVAVLPSVSEQYHAGLALLTLPLILHYISEIRLYSSFFKLHQVKSGFGKIITKTLLGDISGLANMSGTDLHWRVIQRHYGLQDDTKHPEIFMPHVQPEDFYWKKAEEVLFEIDPSLAFWKNSDCLAVMGEDKKPISFHLIDNAMATYTNAPFEQRFVRRAQESILNELHLRYMKHEMLSNQVLRQLEDQVVNKDRIYI